MRCLVKNLAMLFQFYIVALIVDPKGQAAKETSLFQFYIVALIENILILSPDRPYEFQFYIVALIAALSK